MRYRPFGRTGLEVSELVFGGGWVGGILIHQDDATKRAAIERALAAGINWIDTAPSYGDGESERALGWLLEGVADKPYLSTKVRLDLSRLDDIPGQIRRSTEESLSRLRCDSVELLQLHNPIGPENVDQVVGIDQLLGEGGVADALDHMREQGLTRLIGITAIGETEYCRRAIASGRFDSAQVYHNILNPSAARDMPPAWHGHNFRGMIAACKEHGVAIMNIRVLAAGVLASEQRHGREVPMMAEAAIPTEEQRARAVWQRLGERYGTRAQTAIRFALANSDIDCVVVGLAEISHLEEALAAAEMGPLPDEALAELGTVYEKGFGPG
jgi:L-galactose dehydrogenase/L-glyceraldehyde 3-phosphate reductase